MKNRRNKLYTRTLYHSLLVLCIPPAPELLEPVLRPRTAFYCGDEQPVITCQVPRLTYRFIRSVGYRYRNPRRHDTDNIKTIGT